MVRTSVLVLVVGAVLVAAVPAVAVPPLYGTKESFEDYVLGSDGPLYTANWATMPGCSRIAVKANKPWTGSKNIEVVDSQYGLTYDLVPDIQAVDPTKNAVNGTDANPLVQLLCMWSKNSYPDRKYASFFVELSRGDVHAPVGDASEVLPVIAFGWTRGMGTGTKITPSYFDGMTWHDLGNTDQMAAWNVLRTKIYTDTVWFDNEQDSVGSETKPRAYLGGFDTISLRAPNNDAKARSVDDVWLVEGVLTREEAEGACCLPNGSCIQTDSQATCENAPNNGEYQGDFTSCEDVVCCPDPFADADGDGDVDQDDFGAFQACFTGSGGGVPDGCECFNHNTVADEPDIDEDDWGAFEDCASGPDVPADPSCDDPPA